MREMAYRAAAEENKPICSISKFFDIVQNSFGLNPLGE
jgi:hypothetical protein